MVCSHCNLPGHTYRRCPTITEDEKNAKSEEIKKKKEEAQQRRNTRLENEQRIRNARQARLAQTNTKTQYMISNTQDYEIAIYWSLNNSDTLKRFSYCPGHSSYTFVCIREIHRIIAIPFLEVCEENGPNAMDQIQLNASREIPYKTVFDMKMKDYDGTDIIIEKPYSPPKTEIEQWKESALKSKYLLDQIYKMTGGGKTKAFENIEPMLDMVQDIKIPTTCTEMDKERAGIPSSLTNIT